MVKKITNRKRNINESIDNLKIFADICYIDVYEDGYETGEGKYIEQWTESLSGEYNNLQELIDELHDINEFCTTDLGNYVFFDGRLCTDATTNRDYEEPTEDELEKFKSGEINLCLIHIDIPLEVGVKPHTMTDAEAEQFGAEVY